MKKPADEVESHYEKEKKMKEDTLDVIKYPIPSNFRLGMTQEFENTEETIIKYNDERMMLVSNEETPQQKQDEEGKNAGEHNRRNPTRLKNATEILRSPCLIRPVDITKTEGMLTNKYLSDADRNKMFTENLYWV
ncbi:hypothetical protein L1987_80727 [Smallanthus sonchifolius]|uniref:Uncharacterized protein n=1 Tax=Smallanthus sonchifolius TaxID=185202 RepID=A0ACB8YMV6_9ASTR|nr:hypothetical protein L1987_80727 [Smallanthus sonchifolius]